jgi:SAM-dependent methyltransferase
MGPRRHLSERLFAAYYPRAAQRSEDAGQREQRRSLLANASGRTLEIGAGTGLNLPLYPAAILESHELIVTEPSRFMAPGAALGPHAFLRADAQALPFRDGEFDTVVGTFVLCSMADPVRALHEVARVLRPEGRYLFMEHVRAPDGSRLGRIQDAIAAAHRTLAGGCSPNLRTDMTIRNSGLELEWLTRARQPRTLPTTRPIIAGSAFVSGRLTSASDESEAATLEAELSAARAEEAEAWSAYDQMLAASPNEFDDGPHPAIDFALIARSEAERLHAIVESKEAELRGRA